MTAAVAASGADVPREVLVLRSLRPVIIFVAVACAKVASTAGGQRPVAGAASQTDRQAGMEG